MAQVDRAAIAVTGTFTVPLRVASLPFPHIDLPVAMALDLRDQLQRTLGTAYVLERELGGGGMSRVFVARETALGRTVVVKVLSPELAAGISVDRFRREIQLAAQLQHAHIVPVLAAGETDGLPFYTMPFVEGQSLRTRLSRPPLPIAEVQSYLRDVARALAYAHARGVVHRDIKPDNVLVAGGSAVVTDFGVAKALSNARGDMPGATLTSVGTSLGTPAYMAVRKSGELPCLRPDGKTQVTVEYDHGVPSALNGRGLAQHDPDVHADACATTSSSG